MGSPGSLTQPEALILFDGVCNLCSGSVQFVIRRDPAGYFTFASLQSDTGQQKLKQLGLNQQSFHSIILIKDGQAYQRSDAALEIAKKLTGAWPLLYGFKILPRFLRDAVYNLISKNRYRMFGKKDACW
ncbi:MAG TPA: thiol-disulfide oxidoreductase DCC family protein, partial [Cyclobacteriaceae bacterium]|nr:thiol-disulfide oxidoreductase DCC family protein [Cyclobacteriaceae bacterium]